jgi:hypothetical protein
MSGKRNEVRPNAISVDAHYPRELLGLMEKHFPEKLTAKPAG